MKRFIYTIVAFALASPACGAAETPPAVAPQPEPPPPPPSGGAPGDPGGATVGAGCKVGGCSATVCSEASGEDMMTTCEFKPEYACYRSATCEKQADGACGWTQTPELSACLANPPAE